MSNACARPARIGILGADIATLALALALKRGGFDDLLVYMAPDADAAPPAAELLHLSANGVRVLHALGLRNPLAEAAEQPRSHRLRVGRTGFLLSELPLGNFSASRYGVPDYLIYAHGLWRLLHRAAEDAGIAIRSVQVSAVEPQTGVVKLRAAAPVQHKALVTANASVLRSAATGAVTSVCMPAPGREVGRLWQGSVPLAASADRPARPVIDTWTGSGCYLRTQPSLANRRLHWTACSGDPGIDSLGAMRQALSAWPAAQRTLLTADQLEIEQPLLEPPSRNVFALGKVMLLGAAAHPMPPHLCQAVPAALEDAWVLSRFMEQHEDDWPAAAAQYQHYRGRRVALLQARSLERGAQLCDTVRHRRNWRHCKEALLGRFLPELKLQQQDWIYRYDCIRGFE